MTNAPEHLDPNLDATETESSFEEAGRPTEDDQRVANLVAHTIDVPVLAEAVERLAAADAADALEDLEGDEAADVLEQMDEKLAAEALAEMQTPLALGVIEDLIAESKIAYAGQMLSLMAPDDAADLLQEVGDDARRMLLSELDSDTAHTLRRLIQYDEESAGGLMTTDVLAIPAHLDVASATDFIRSSTVADQTRFALVVDEQTQKLLGIVGLRRLLLAGPSELLSELVRPFVHVLHPEMDREQVARAFDRYDHEMLPVVDHADRLLGIVTVDDVIDIIRQEHTEDVQKTVGAGAEEAVYSGVIEKVRGRFPWLGASLVMTCASAVVVLLFEDLVRTHTILAFLLPVIAALVGNAGHQALAVTLRGIVLGEVRKDRVWPLIWRETAAGGINGVVLGTVMALTVALLATAGYGSNANIGILAGIATAVAMTVGTLAGTSIPIIMRRIGADPAQSSAIFLIMITDGVAFTTLLGLVFLTIGG